ncbi:MAG: carboxylesterase/lipase family protein [Alphaproteobacteria bacterium]|nr:carboxylesterase/lipase family protein [Alphaproteobacteria bacterium]MBV9692353.1 carboxylesterase/lipase family protein [Alphaproteobacteria bacterium]
MDTPFEPVVETAQGRVKGTAKDGVLRFNGIPYAAPPVGALRWRMPEPPLAWSGVRDCTRFGNIAPQIMSAAERLLGGTPGTQSEDCLHLNIWTPSLDSAARPVMVWIHGGAFTTGAGSLGTYNGKRLARLGDVVVVTINYRLGALGFLNLHDASGGRLPGTGAEGIADQIAALRWVTHNIAAFGGNPANVTIFGESAGAMSIGALLAAPQARGLFHKAILQSGAAHIGRAREDSAKIARLFLDSLRAGDASAILSAPHETILRAQGEILERPGDTGGLPFGPTIDGQVLGERAIAPVRLGSAAGIAVLTGTTKDEWKLFTAARPKLRLMNEAKLLRYTAGLVGDDRAETLLKAYAGGSPFERWNAVMTDHSFAVPAARLLEAQAPHAPVYAYRFDWRSPLLGGVLGSCHALELGFVFGTYNEKMAGAFFGSGSDADALSAAMMQAWVNFARSGDPSSGATAAWPRYDTATRATMILGSGEPHVAQAPDDARRAAWDTIDEARIGP